MAIEFWRTGFGPEEWLKKKTELDEWNNEIAPSTELRRWFNHQEEHFEEFTKCYHKELKAKTEELNRLGAIAKTNIVTLSYRAKDQKINHAVVLRNFLVRV